MSVGILLVELQSHIGGLKKFLSSSEGDIRNVILLNIKVAALARRCSSFFARELTTKVCEVLLSIYSPAQEIADQ